jgi:xylulose-5-phosphate/fructose-6-phosphate phosphoketolase
LSIGQIYLYDIDHVLNTKAEIVRVYLAPDANCLLSAINHCLRSRHYLNVVIVAKHPARQWLTRECVIWSAYQAVG